MALLKDFEGDLEPVEVGRSDTGSPLMPAGEEEGFQMHRPKDRKDKRSRLAEEGKKMSSLSLRRGKQKETTAEKTPKRGKHVRSKSGSRTPPDSPKASRAADASRRPSKPAAGPLQPSPNVKNTRKRYAVLGKENVSTESEPEEESGLMVSNQAVAVERPEAQDLPQPPEAPSSPSGLQTLFPVPPTHVATTQFPMPFTSQRELTPERTTPQEPLAPFAFQNPLTQDLPSPSQPPSGNPYVHQFFLTPMPAPPLQPTMATAPPNPLQASEGDWTISEELRLKCTRQFAELCPEDGRLLGDKARAFFIQSRLPNLELSQIWRLSDMDRDNALSVQEFCVAMKLVLMRRRGHAIPAALPEDLKPQASEGPFSDSFVPSQLPPQPLPPPPLHGSHRHRPPKATQSAIELHPPSQSEEKPSDAPSTSNVPLAKVVQQSSPDLLKVTDSADSHVTNPIYVEIDDKSTSDMGLLVEKEEEEGSRQVVGEPPVGRIISYESANESEEGDGSESSAFLQKRKRASSESNVKESPQQPKLAPLTKPANVGRSKSLRQAPSRPELPPRPVVTPPTHQEVLSPPPGESETAPMISVVDPSPKAPRRSSRPAALATKTKKYQNIESGSSSPGSPAKEEEEEGRQGFTRLRLTDSTAPSKRGHARSTSLDLTKVIMPSSEVVADVPPAVPPPPPPKPRHPPSRPSQKEEEDKPVARGRSASTGSISSSGHTTIPAPVEKRSVTPEDPSMDTSTDQLLLGHTSSPPTRPRQQLKKAPLFPPKPRRPPPPVKPKPEPELEAAEHSKPEEERPARSKSQLQVTIRSLKETNATLVAINKGLEERLFTIMEERVRLSREVELAQSAQHQHH